MNENILSYLTVGFAPYNNYPELKTGKYVIDDYYDALYDYICSFSGDIAITLSGGKDSRLLAELCKKAGHNTTTITFGYDKNSIENRIAEKVSNKLGMKHVLLAIKPEMYTADNFSNLTNVMNYQVPWQIPSLIYYMHKNILSDFDAIFDGWGLTLTLRERRFYRTKDTFELMSSIIHFDDIIKCESRELIQNKLINRFKNMTPDQFCYFLSFDSFAEQYFFIKQHFFNLCIPFFDSSAVRDVYFSIPEKDIIIRMFRKYNLCTAHIQMTTSPFPLWFPWYIHYGYTYINGFKSNIRGLKSKVVLNQGIWLQHRIKYVEAIKKLCKDIHLENLIKDDVFDEHVLIEKMNNVDCREDYALVIERLINYFFWKMKYDN